MRPSQNGFDQLVPRMWVTPWGRRISNWQSWTEQLHQLIAHWKVTVLTMHIGSSRGS